MFPNKNRKMEEDMVKENKNKLETASKHQKF
jgi:hypothetical protein